MNARFAKTSAELTIPHNCPMVASVQEWHQHFGESTRGSPREEDDPLHNEDHAKITCHPSRRRKPGRVTVRPAILRENAGENYLS